MTSVVAPVEQPRRLLRQPLGFVWAAWRALTRRQFYYAALLGLGLALVEGTGVAMWSWGIWWQNFLSVFAPSLTLALFLLLCLSVAAGVSVTRGPRWVPFAVAAAVASVITPFTQWIVALSSGMRGSSWSLLSLCVNWSGGLLISTLAALGYMYGFDAVRRTDVLRSLQLERTRVAREAYEARLKALQARVEPRFLFDTLAAIEAAYAASPESGQRLIDQLIVYLRAALPTMEKSTSSLSAELTLVRAWLDIVRMRRADSLTILVDTPPFARDVKMPPMILLPLVQHAVECARDGAQCGITVSAALDDRLARIVVTASGPKCELPTETAATAAIHERLLAIYGTNASLRFVNTDRNEYRANLEVPA